MIHEEDQDEYDPEDAQQDDDDNQNIVDEGYEVNVEGDEEDDEQVDVEDVDHQRQQMEEQPEYGDEVDDEEMSDEDEEPRYVDQHGNVVQGIPANQDPNQEMDDMEYDPEMEGEYDDEGDVIEIAPDQLEALILRYQAKQNGQDPGPPILDENGEPIELTD
jgi:hypothetical protein